MNLKKEFSKLKLGVSLFSSVLLMGCGSGVTTSVIRPATVPQVAAPAPTTPPVAGCVAISKAIPFVATGVTVDSKILAGKIPALTSKPDPHAISGGTFGTMKVGVNTSSTPSNLAVTVDAISEYNNSRATMQIRSNTTQKEVSGTLSLSGATIQDIYTKLSPTSQPTTGNPLPYTVTGSEICVSNLGISLDISNYPAVKGRIYLYMDAYSAAGKTGYYVEF